MATGTDKIEVLTTIGKKVETISFDAEITRFLVLNGEFIAGGPHGRIFINSASGKVVREAPLPEGYVLTNLAHCRGAIIASLRQADRSVTLQPAAVFALEPRKNEFSKIPGVKGGHIIAIESGARSFYTGGADGSIYGVDSASFAARLLAKQESIVGVLSADPSDDSMVVSGDGDGTVRAWDLRTQKDVILFKKEGFACTALVFHPILKRFIAGFSSISSTGGAIAVLDISKR